jgi:hypothetical protein
MWHVDLSKPNDVIIHKPIAQANKLGGTMIKESLAFAHATLFSPVLSTLENALSNHCLTNFPGLDL